MSNEQEQEREERVVVLPKEVWLETDSHAEAEGTSSSDVIEKALCTYFDLTGKVHQAADVQEESVSKSVEAIARVIDKLPVGEGTGVQKDLHLVSSTYRPGRRPR